MSPVQVRSERASLAAILTMVNAVRRRVSRMAGTAPQGAIADVEDALQTIEEEARGLLEQVRQGIHANPRRNPLMIVGNPPGNTFPITVFKSLGWIEHLTYQRTVDHRGPYFHDFGKNDALVPAEIALGKGKVDRVVVIWNANGRALWGDR